MKRIVSIAAISFAAFALARCGGSDPSPPQAGNAPADGAAMKGMPGMQQSAQATHMGEGTLNSIDKTAGAVNITHGPVASAGWPGMTMSFKLADPAAVPDVQPGQRVKFEFTIQSGMAATVTKITPME